MKKTIKEYVGSYAVIPMLFGLVFAGLYRECKKRINDK